MNDWNLPEVFAELRRLAGEPDRVYIIGGAVRDMLLQRPSHDLDFGVAGRAIPLARRLADRLNAAFYVLDDEHDVARVLGASYALDFAGLRGSNLKADLQARDFTINAIAVDVMHPEQIIDPLNGAQDLKDSLLRACSPASLFDDPLRGMRGIRQAVALGLRIHPDTWQWIKDAAPGLARVSPERQRDELFRILSGKNIPAALRLLDAAGTLPVVLPELAALRGAVQGPPHVYDVWEHTLALIARLESLYDLLVGEYSREAADLTLGLAVLRLGRFREQFAAHFAESINPQRDLRALLFLAALYHDAAKPLSRSVDEHGRVHYYGHDERGLELVENRARALMLSNPEIDRLKTLVGSHMRAHLLAKENPMVSRRAIYRYFRATGPAGVELCLLSLADMLAVYGPTLPQAAWQAELDVCRSLLEAWWDKPAQLVNPPRLLTGDDLQRLFGLKPGRQIGDLLEALAEAQAAGEVTTPAEAEALLRTRLT